MIDYTDIVTSIENEICDRKECDLESNKIIAGQVIYDILTVEDYQGATGTLPLELDKTYDKDVFKIMG